MASVSFMLVLEANASPPIPAASAIVILQESNNPAAKYIQLEGAGWETWKLCTILDGSVGKHSYK
jgi:hypothetical protein